MKVAAFMSLMASAVVVCLNLGLPDELLRTVLGLSMKSGSWWSITLIYLYGVLGVASLSKVIPLKDLLAATIAMTEISFGLFVSLLMLPAALLASLAGGVIDRVGSRKALMFCASIGAITNVGFLFAASTSQFQTLRLVEGLGMLGIFSAAPALIMSTCEGQRRIRAMALWSTATPVGVSLGLLLGGVFAASSVWREMFVVHATLFVLAFAMGVLLPKTPSQTHLPSKELSQRLVELVAIFGEPGPLRLALTFGALVFVGFGTSTILPSYLARAHGLTISVASTLVAVANLSMLMGSVLSGALLSKGMRPRLLLILIAFAGGLASFGLYAPGLPFPLALSALTVWLLATGAANALVVSSLPLVISSPARGAAAAGLLSQISSLITFITPPAWLLVAAKGSWWMFCVMACATWLLAIYLLPSSRAETIPGAPLVQK
jgi:predicted MFS family arabinose efflux permease